MMSHEPWIERILRVVDFIHAHLEEDLTPEHLADVAQFSLHHFHRVFRGVTGESTMEFVRRLRLERAATRLRFGDASVTDVAFASGYGSHEAFTRAFRARFGEAPSAFRERARIDVAQSKPMTMRTAAARHCVAHRYVGPYSHCEQAWAELMSWAGPIGLATRSSESLGLCYDDPDVTAPDKLRYDACLVVTEAELDGIQLDGRRCIRVVPGGTYAVARHEGPYEDIHDTYVALLGRFLPRRDIELPDEPVVEIYLNNPMDTVPVDLRTEVCVRITQT